MISWEINVVCDGMFDFGQFGSCEGCFTTPPDDTRDVAGAIAQAEKEGWTQKDGNHFCPSCSKVVAATPGKDRQ